MAAGPLPRGDERQGAQSNKPDPGLVALLSLKLLLLAFFILLTALSRYEQDRVHKVVESVTDAFGARFVSEIAQPRSAAGLGFHEAMKPVAEELRRTAAATLPVELEIEVRRDGELRIEIPYDLLFDPTDAAPRATVRPLFVAVARALTGPRFEDHPWTMEASARLPGLGSRGVGLESDLAVRRAAGVVRSLRALGLPEDRLAAGLLDGDARRLRIAVRPLGPGLLP